MNTRTVRILTTALLTGTIVLSSAVQPVAASDLVEELRLKTGSQTATINGEKQTIHKPYIEQGTLMVPVGVFKKAFDSEIRLTGEDVVKVMDGPHTVALTIGSKIAWIDGEKVEMAAAPKMVKDVLMVPLRPVAAGIGATLQKSEQGELVIRMKANGAEAPHENPEGEIDTDLGKTKIGNSYYEWSMNYPTGLIVGGSYNESEDFTSFMNAEGTYYLEVLVSDQEVELDAEDMLQQLVQDAKDMGETVMDREAYGGTGTPYARIVTKDGDGMFWEARQYYDNGRLYEIYFSDYEAVNYKDLQQHAPLLNSFRTSFNTSDTTIKDLSTVENGMTTVYNEDYGIALSVPAEWDKDNQSLVYESKEGTHLSLQVTSAPEGASIKDWSDKLNQWMQDVFVEDAHREVDSYTLNVAGKDAQVNQFQYDFGDGWTTEYNVLIQENGYRYYLEYAVPEAAAGDERLFEQILASLEIDYDTVSENFGKLGEDPYLVNKSSMITRTSKKYGYTLDIPRYWTPVENRFESTIVAYQFTGGFFSIHVDKEVSVELVVSQLRESYAEAAQSRKDFRVTDTKNMTFAGQPATEFTYHEVEKGVPMQGRQLVFEHDGITYTVTAVLNDANRTEVQLNAVSKTLESFSFNK